MKQKCYGMIFVGKNFGKIIVSDRLKRSFQQYSVTKNLYKSEAVFLHMSINRRIFNIYNFIQVNKSTLFIYMFLQYIIETIMCNGIFLCH